MIRKLVWCLFVLFLISENHCSLTERELYVFSSLANAEQTTTEGKPLIDEVQDAETAETNTYSDPYGGTTEFVSEDAALEDAKEDPQGPEDHVIPYSEHEDPGEVPTRPKYVAPGTWAKPDPKKNIPLDFVPTKTLAQVRGTHTVKVLPQSEAIASAVSDEEKANAPRLREVVSKKKTNTIYTEEGYEDSAYDHAGHIRDADFHEGYARKLHDERGSKTRSGARGNSKKRKSKNRSSRPRAEEFVEFADDYSDESAPSDKYKAEGSSTKEKQDHVNKIYKEMWKKPDVNPKIVTENEIEKLEIDLKREDEEAEKGSENYGSDTDRDPHRYYNSKEKNSDNFETQTDIESNTDFPSFGKKENFYTENYEATTVQFGTPAPGESGKYEAATSGYENPTTNRYYLPDGSAVQENYEATTLNYGYPNNQQSGIAEAQTTMNYGELFWKYYQTKPNEATSPGPYLQDQTTVQQPLLLRETTTLGPFDDQTKPVAVATINGHGPYLLVSENGGTTQNPGQFGAGDFPHYSTVQNGHQPYVNPNGVFGQEYGFANSQGINSRNGPSFPGFDDPHGPATPGYGAWGLNSAAYGAQIPVISTEPPTTRFYDNIAFSSTPTYSLISSPPNDYESSKAVSGNSPHKKIPFLNSAEVTDRSDDNYNHENSESYKEWLTSERNPSAQGGEQYGSGAGSNQGVNSLKPKSHGNKRVSFFGYKPNLEYSKMLSLIKSRQNGMRNGQKSESADSDDFTIMKPPALRESVFSDFTLNSYPNVAGHSSVMQESEAAQETDRRKIDAKKIGAKHNGPFQKDLHFKTPTFYGNRPPGGINRKKLFPAAKLLPPSPNSRDDYADLSFSKRNNGFHDSSKRANLQQKLSYGNGVKNYSPDPEQLARYLRNRNAPSRYRRSLGEVEISQKKGSNALGAGETNARLNFSLEDEGSGKHRDVGERRSQKLRVKRNLIPEERQFVTEDLTPLAKEVFSNENDSKIHDNRRLRIKRSHQDLLDASHKIAGDVINKEIDSRFKSKDYDDDDEEEEEEDDEARREKQVEIEAPDLDYLDEIQEANDIENIPTTTVASVDLQKYPFYKNTKIPNYSPLKYIINPKEVPKKTFGGMEFYDSRDKYVQCEEVDPNLEEVLPDEEEPVPNRGPKQNLPRLRGLGDKLDCFKAKLFGKDPFDNPLFFEKKVNQPTPPTELNPKKLARRILEMPEENRDYFVPAQSRKPESTPVKRIDNSHQRTKSQNLGETSNVKSSTEPRTRRRNNLNRNKVLDPSTQKPPTVKRRNPRRRPVQNQQTTTTESPEVISVTPYQKEVYEDVMGTIKNLASLYEMFGAQTVSPLTEAPIASSNAGNLQGASSIRNIQTLNRVPNLSGKREKDFRSVGVTESPFHEEIEGLLPPPELNRKPKIVPYRTNKVSYNTRIRTESPPRSGDKKIIGYFRTVMVHKRSLDDIGGARIDPETKAGYQTARNKRNVFDSENQESRVNLRTVNPPVTSSTTEKPRRGRRRKTSPSSTTTTTVKPVTSHATTENDTPKPYYTVRGRSRNSKDEKSSNRYGLFTTTQRTSAATDGRRNEPRYTEIMRRRGEATTTTTTTTTTTPSPQKMSETNSTTSTANPDVDGSRVQPALETGEIYETDDSVPRRRKVRIEETGPSSDIYETVASDFVPDHVEEDEEDSENYEEEEEDSTEEPVEKIRKYDVHEDVQEDTTPSTVGFSEPTKTSEFVDLETYLSTDPPGYNEAFGDRGGTTAPYANLEEARDPKENYSNEESKEELVAEDDEERSEAPRVSSSYREEESDEDSTESPRSSESYKDHSSENLDESGDEKKSTEQEDGDDKTFFRYNVRPDSPFESFEDEKYSDLGPRVNKPAFHHPPFEAPKYERQYSVDSDEEEKDKTDESLEKEKYLFPWSRDEEDEKAEAEEGYVDQASEKYEYPWEKRERLAEERAKRRKDRLRLQKLKDFSFLNDDDDFYEDEDEKQGSSSQTSGKRTYPWDQYDVPSKPYKKHFSKNDAFDSDETSSEHRPIAKFSSKYSSNKFKIPFAGSEPITTAQPQEIRESVLKFLKEADEKTSETTEAYETDASAKPGLLTDDKTSEPTEKILSTKEPVPSRSKNAKRISNSRIIPENITTAPRNRSRSRGTPIRDRTTLRPIIRSTTETVAVAKSQTTEAPVLTTRRPSRVRGRQPSYKAQESRITSSAVEPTPKSTTTTTTEEPATSTTKNPVKYTVRKRVKPKTVSDSVKTGAETSRERQENVTERSTQATTTTNRRRTRPTVATRPVNTKTDQKKFEKAKRPSRVDTKNMIKEMTYDEYRIPTRSSVDSEDRDIEDSTPTSRTVEHRSRVSTEQLITKTSFPDLDNAYKFSKNKSTAKKLSTFNKNFEDESLANRKPKRNYSETPDRGRKSFGGTKGDNEKPVRNESIEKLSIMTQETPEHVYEKKEVVDKDGHKEMFVSIIPKNRTVGPSAMEDDLHLRKAEMENLEKPEEQAYEKFDGTKTRDAESNRDIGSTLPEDSLPGQVLREIPSRSNKLKESKDNYHEDDRTFEKDLSAKFEDRHRKSQGDDESEEDDEAEEKSPLSKFEKDPKQRLYYYLDHKK